MNPTNFVTQMELGLKEIGLGNFWEALAQFQLAEQLAGELSSFSSERLAYGYSRIERPMTPRGCLIRQRSRVILRLLGRIQLWAIFNRCST